LHLHERALLIILVGKANESIASALAGHGIRHNLGRLARGEACLEQGNEDILVDLGAKITNEDAVFGTSIVTAWD
jgi:hypothetical protein